MTKKERKFLINIVNGSQDSIEKLKSLLNAVGVKNVVIVTGDIRVFEL